MQNAESLGEIRRRIRAIRREVPTDVRSRWSAEICRRFSQLKSFQTAQRVAGFLAFDGEADPLELMKIAVERGQHVFVPIVVARDQPLLFAPWSPGCKMSPNRFGIAEPAVPKSEWIEASALDFVITPLVAFDESCNRIGVGGGFYDRSFSRQTEIKTGYPVSMVGFAFELQKIDAIQRQPWDVPLSGVITESAGYGNAIQ